MKAEVDVAREVQIRDTWFAPATGPCRARPRRRPAGKRVAASAKRIIAGRFQTTMTRRIVLCVFVVAVGMVVCPVQADDTTTEIRQFLEGLDAGESPWIAGRRLNEPELVTATYRSRNHAPIWVEGGALAGEVSALMDAVSRSVGHGFSAERYHRSTLEQLLGSGGDGGSLALEVLLTDAFLSQALHRGRGAVFPPNLDAEWQVPPADVDAIGLLRDVADRGSGVVVSLDALWPAAEDYALLLQKRAAIVASGDEHTIQIAPGPLMRPGQTGDRVRMLKERLKGPGEYTDVYDGDLLRDVIAFQRASGLEPDGLVGEGTLEVLNATRVSWIERIDANLERWRWLPRKTPATYIRVNIAAFTLRAFENNEQALAMDVIVGRPYRRTPVFTETLKYLVVNPYWNVPYSIATRDKLTLLKSNASAEAAKGFEAKLQGTDTFVAVDAVDWSGVTSRNFNYLLRQRPGPDNALGRVKFMMPNPHAVYLHDTPSRELFQKQERSFSSGCVRLSQPMALARWLLSREQHAEAGDVEALASRGETVTIYLREPVPTYIVYFTAFVTDDKDVAFRRDIYARDAVLIDALRAQESPQG